MNTVSTLLEQKRRGNKITMLTAYDYTTAKIIDQCGVKFSRYTFKDNSTSTCLLNFQRIADKFTCIFKTFTLYFESAEWYGHVGLREHSPCYYGRYDSSYRCCLKSCGKCIRSSRYAIYVLSDKRSRRRCQCWTTYQP